jgi:ankyrin repeat protein
MKSNTLSPINFIYKVIERGDYPKVLELYIKSFTSNYFLDVNNILLKAILCNRYETCKFLLKSNVDPNTTISNKELIERFYEPEYQYCSLLFYAIDQQYYTIADLLIEYGANVNMTFIVYIEHERNNVFTLLELFVRANNIQNVKYILDKGASIHNSSLFNIITTFNDENEPINIEMVDLLLKYGAKVDQLDDTSETLLFTAISDKNVNLVILLLEYNANPNHRNLNNETPLYNAILFNDTSIAKLLLDTHADVNHKVDNMYLLHYAIDFKYIDMIKLLVEYSADITNKTTDGKTALQMAIEYNLPRDIIDLLSNTRGFKRRSSLMNQ